MIYGFISLAALLATSTEAKPAAEAKPTEVVSPAVSGLKPWSAKDQVTVDMMADRAWIEQARQSYSKNHRADAKTLAAMSLIDEELKLKYFGRPSISPTELILKELLEEKKLDPASAVMVMAEGMQLTDFDAKFMPQAALLGQRIKAQVASLDLPLRYAYWRVMANCLPRDKGVIKELSNVLVETLGSVPAKASGRELDGYAHRISNFLDRNSNETASSLAQKSGQGHPWIQSYLNTHLEVELAWKSRGFGLANTVSEEGWKGFKKHLLLAEESGLKCEALNPQTTMATAKRLTIGMGLGTDSEQMNAIWRRGLDVNPAELSLYQRRGYAASPNWGGGRTETFLLAQELLDNPKWHSPLLPKMFEGLLGSLVMQDANAKATPEYAQLCLKLWQTFNARESRGEEHTWSRKTLLKYLTESLLSGQQREVIAEIYAEIDLDKEIGLESVDVNELCGALLLNTKWSALSQVLYDRLDWHADTDLSKAPVGEELDQLIKQLEEASREAGAKSKVFGIFFKNWKEICEIRKQFLSGKTVELPFAQTHLWTPFSGKCQAQDDGSMVMSVNAGSGLFSSMVNFTPPYLLECEVEILESSNPGSLHPGVIAGRVLNRPMSGRYLYVNPVSGEYGIEGGYRNRFYLHHSLKDKPKQRGIRAVIWDKCVELSPAASPNGIVEYSSTPLPYSAHFKPFRIGIGMTGADEHSSVRFSHLRVTKIDLIDEAMRGDQAQQLAYWQRRCELCPEAQNVSNWSQLLYESGNHQKAIDAAAAWRYMSPRANQITGLSLSHLGKYDEAAKAFQQAIDKTPLYYADSINELKAQIALARVMNPQAKPAQLEQSLNDAQVLIEKHNSAVRCIAFQVMARVHLAKADKAKAAKYFAKAIYLAGPEEAKRLEADKAALGL